ncbi:NRDE family protein [Undibacterium sp.]|uniref:NRDE family protein n=1 Tax=Undibacterium sp. TaxID=1914977 RepID=UPI00374CC667
MCLIVFAWKLIPSTPLIVAGNRDEFYERPAAPASWWQDAPHIYAGRDLQAGGTWMGIASDDGPASPASRFAAITNIRAPSEKRPEAPSRGALVSDFLTGSMSAAEYVEQIRNGAQAYNGFNLLLGDGKDLIWFSNRWQQDERNGRPLPPGIYGVSNAALDTPWPKVVSTKAEFSSLLCQRAPEDAYFEMLADSTKAPDCRLPETGVSLDMERLLSSAFIASPTYGTRASSLLRIHDGQPAEFLEKVAH